jgi:hypothetical protein
MASEYGYATVADLEERSGIDYSAKASKYTDDVVEAVISQGEREINTKVGTSFSGTIPDAIKSTTIELAYRRMYNMMVWDGIMDRANPKQRLMKIWDDDIYGILEPYIAKEQAPINLHNIYNNDPYSYGSDY